MTRQTRWLVLAGLGAAALFVGCSGSDEQVFPPGGGMGGTTTGTTGGGGTTTGTTGGGGSGGSCVAPQADCDGDPANGCETNTDTDTDHCGACGSPCGEQHATAQCVDGQCVLSCEAPWDDCDGDPTNGCETDTDSELAHCGGCDQSCATECTFGLCVEPCDDNLAIDEADPVIALQAIGLCSGVQAADWVQSDGGALPADPGQLANFHLGHGILPDFGSNVNPQEGTRVLALSSGTARRPTDPDYQSPQGFDKGYLSGHPQGFPKAIPSCPGVTSGDPHDAAGIEFTVTAPANAEGFSFTLKKYTFEWPQWVCTIYTDQFVAMLDPPPPNLPDGNVSFDSLGNTIGAHSEFIDVCTCANPPCQAGGLSFPCSLGDAELQGTGFEQHAATGWLETRVPITAGGTITVRFTTYDSGDGIIDSTTLVDKWRWIASPGQDPETTVLANPL